MTMTRRISILPTRMTLTLALLVITHTASSADRLWDGGGGDANWSTVNNWDGDASAPVSNDALFFGGVDGLANSNNLNDDPLFAGITFNASAGAFTLSGYRLILGGSLVNNDSDTQTVSLPMILDATRAVNAAAGDITLDGTLSGAGGLIKEGGKTLWLRGDSTFAGDVTVSNGTLVVQHSNALGGTAGKTTVMGTLGGYIYLGNNITLAEPMVLNGELNNGGTLGSWGENTLSGPVTCYNQPRFHIQGGTLVISGGVTQSDVGGIFVINSSATVVFNTTPLTLGAKVFYTDAQGLTVLSVAGNSWAETMVAQGTLRTDVPNALPATAGLQVGVGYGPSGTLNLNGCNQTVSKLFVGSTDAGARLITSPAPALLTVNQGADVDTTFDGSLTGAAGLCKTGSGRLTLANAATTTTGDFIVSNGTLVVTATASLGNSPKVVVAGGALELQTEAAIADSASLSIEDGGAKVLIDSGLTETVGSLSLGGVPQRRGTYGATGSGAGTIDDNHFSGSGKIRVLSNPPITPVNATWDAGGTGTLLNTPENWVGDATPALDGTAYVTFGTGGNTAMVNTEAGLYGIAFNRDGDFILENGGGALTLGLGGIAAASPSAGYRLYRVSEQVTLAEPQTWNVDNAPGADTRLDFTEAIGDGDFPMGITKTGNGTLHLAGNNTYDGVTTIENGGILLFNSAALGSTAGGTVIHTVTPSGTSAWIGLPGGLTLTEPITIVDGSVNGSCIGNWGGTNTISGPITTSSARYFATEGTRLNITGGVTGSNPFFVINAAGTIAFSSLPLNLGAGGFFWTDTYGLTVIGVAGNTWGDTMVANGTLRTDVPNALPPSTRLLIGGISWAPNGTVDLNGCDQTVSGVRRFENNPGTIIVTSATPATLTVVPSDSVTYDGQLTGELSLVKTGGGSLTLTGASSTIGTFTVSEGVLAVSGAGTLGNSTNVTVAATGTLSLQTSSAIADTATLTVVDGGTAKVELADGVNETVGWLWLSGKLRRAGTYGATGSGAQVIDNDHFTGTGRLTVLHDKSATLMKLR